MSARVLPAGLLYLLPASEAHPADAGPYADSVSCSTQGNSGPPGQGHNHAAAPPSAGRAHPFQRSEHTVEHRFKPSRPGAPNHTAYQQPVGPTHPCHKPLGRST
ncbi:hypothetical protein G5714_011168 [Onychostoma macrolepis]|uniref:Secreted protein n=1 Tax=Onychostoma macrolepis TaxID=369639 RepID=A0A7J6CM46_9TELE|nr:hypothetical protein G5714_011168 [Onychostoma macrolepis]